MNQAEQPPMTGPETMIRMKKNEEAIALYFVFIFILGLFCD
jgi:hypothetical protein